jgi:uncharacterized protein (TIGR03435 family)
MRLTLFAAFACALAAQTPDSQVVFEVATVKHGPPRDYSAAGCNCGPGTRDPTRFAVTNYPISSIIQIAYGVGNYQVSGPVWIDEERFTIAAKVPEGATKEQLKLMLQNLLKERFKLTAHFARKDVAGYQLVVAKGGPKLIASAGDPNQNADPGKAAEFKMKLDREGYPELPLGRNSSMAISGDRARWRFADESMDAFARTIAEQMIRQPVMDATGLTGKYDFVMSFSYASMQPNAPADSGPSVFAALEEQLGLKLESKKFPVDTVVIDHLERVPTGN